MAASRTLNRLPSVQYAGRISARDITKEFTAASKGMIGFRYSLFLHRLVVLVSIFLLVRFCKKRDCDFKVTAFEVNAVYHITSKLIAIRITTGPIDQR